MVVSFGMVSRKVYGEVSVISSIMVAERNVGCIQYTITLSVIKNKYDLPCYLSIFDALSKSETIKITDDIIYLH